MAKGWSQIAVRKEDAVKGNEVIADYKKKLKGKITHNEIYNQGVSWYKRLLSVK